MLHLVTVDAVRQWLKEGAPSPAAIIGLDLSELETEFEKVSLKGSIFINCKIVPGLVLQIFDQSGALIADPGVLTSPLSSFRSELYTVGDLYRGMKENGENWTETPDYKGYAFFWDTTTKKPYLQKVLQPVETLAARIHDTMQENALPALLRDRKVIAVMGGHDFSRETTTYWDCVRIAKELTEKGFFIVSGGGPGLMEAANLGALLAGSSDNLVSEIEMLLPHAHFEDAEWRRTAQSARARILGAAWDAQPREAQWSLGIPTWLYGNEPPNLFASHHCKMFYNSLREDGLVTLANGGIIFFEGNAGTIQEIFQDATQNYYRRAGQSATPMVFYNLDGCWDRSPSDVFWSTGDDKRRKPLLPLIKQLAVEKNFERAVRITSDRAAVVKFLIDANKASAAPRLADFRLGNVQLNVLHLR